MTQTLDERLSTALAERERLAAQAQKIQGKKEAAEKSLSDLRAEIKAKNLDPDTLDETIQKLEVAYEEAVETLESEIRKAREALTPYMESK